jgi:hypothetical protein
MSEDIVTRLRVPIHATRPPTEGMHEMSERERQLHTQYLECRLLMSEASDEIERLRAEYEVALGLCESQTINIEQLREAIVRNGGKDWIP